MAMQVQVSDSLVNDLTVLEDIVDDANHGPETIKLTTDQGNVTASRVTLSTELTDSTLDIVLDLNGNTLTFTSTVSVDKTTKTNGVAEALRDIAELMRAGADQIKTIAATKFP